MRPLPERDADLMREQLIEHGPDQIRFHDGRGFDELVAFHRSMNLLEHDMDANLPTTLRRDAPDLAAGPRSTRRGSCERRSSPGAAGSVPR